MTGIFFAHAPEDRAKADQIRGALRYARLHSPVAWGDAALDADAPRCVVVLWSSSSVNLEWVLEVAHKARRNNTYLPVRIDEVQVPAAFSNVVTADLRSWTGDLEAPEFRQFVKTVVASLESSLHRSESSGESNEPMAAAPTSASNRSPDLRLLNSATRNEERNVARVKVTSSIFLCYRREDTQDAAGRLHDRLVDNYGPDRVFLDIDSVPLGVNFVTYIASQLQQCAAVLVMIGRDWTTINDGYGKRRLDDPADHVRVEVAAALRQGVPVIPVLVQNASMPRANDLPEDIRPLAYQNALKLTPEFWRAGFERLLKELNLLMGGKP